MSTPPVSPGASGGRSHLAAHSKVVGDLEFPGTVEMLGTVEGRVTAAAIQLEAGGRASGTLIAGSIAIKGQFEGEIAGGQVRLFAGARASGQISYDSLGIDEGAEIDATCRRRPAGA
jgi:cytoskeletal protein CcmA (bactofilin family)